MTRTEAARIIQDGNATAELRAEAFRVYYSVEAITPYAEENWRNAVAFYTPPAPGELFGTIANSSIFQAAQAALFQAVGDVTYYKGRDGQLYSTTTLVMPGIAGVAGNEKWYPRFLTSGDVNDVNVRGGVTQAQLDWVARANATAIPICPGGVCEDTNLPAFQPTYNQAPGQTPTTVPSGEKAPQPTSTGSGTIPPNTGHTADPTDPDEPGISDFERIKRMTMNDPQIAGVNAATPDQWCYYYNVVVGAGTCPDPSMMGYAGVKRNQAITAEEWWEAVQKFKGSGGRGAGEAPAPGGGAPAAPGGSGNPFFAMLKEHGLRFLFGALVTGGEIYEDTSRPFKESVRQSQTKV